MLHAYLPAILWLIGFVVVCVIAFWLIEKIPQGTIKLVVQIAAVIGALIILLSRFGVF